MPTLITYNCLNRIILNLFVFFLFSGCLALAQNTPGAGHQVEPTALESQAREYREEGIKMQDMGDIDSAMKLYQKAVEVDPAYAVAYNDLGVIYEAKGMADRAEESYLKAIKIDPYYLSTYSNLALFYENKRELKKAAYCWSKRAELGDIGDSWTQRANQRLNDIRLSLSPHPEEDLKEQDTLKLMKDVANEKYLLRHDDKMLSRKHFNKARESYAQKDYAAAVKEALDAQYLDPDNKDIQEFIDKAQHRALSR